MDERKGQMSANPNRSRGTKGRFTVVFCFGLILLLGLTSSFSPAQTSMELIRWREFSYAKEIKETGGQMTLLSAVNRSGFIVLGDGEFARLSGWIVHTNTLDGREHYQGFTMYDFQDGSSILAKVDVSGDVKDKKVGSIVFVAGTGRFRGITGRGTTSSWMPKQWEIYAEIDGSFSTSVD